MEAERRDIEFLCRANCPFDRQCGQGYIDEESVCVESVHYVIDVLNGSLDIDPVLDKERPTREYFDLKRGENMSSDMIPLSVMLRMSDTHKKIRIRFGEIEQGKVIAYPYTDEVYERIKDAVPAVIKKD